MIAVAIVAIGTLIFVTAPPTQNDAAAVSRPIPSFKQEPQDIPTRITITSLDIDIPVTTGTFDPESHQWTLDESGAFWAEYSEAPNDTKGTTFIYAHARWGLFGALPDITSGAEALIFTQSGQVYRYHFESANTVEPEDTTVFARSGKPKLVLQTCSGTFSQNRTLYSFSLLSAEKPS